ncbi:MAG: SIS domain-containing protein [Chloroflexota bacterium]|nr:SIS domain-containing protein [Chloroflexota bacterium]
MTELAREIAQQPDVIAALIGDQRDAMQRIAAAVHTFDPAFVVIAARGTSDNAARYAQYTFGVHLGKMVALATPSVHTLYDAAPDMRRALVIGVSQSGQSADVRQVITDARAQGALTLTITNDAGSPLARAAEYHVPIGAGDEKSVAATKSYTAQLTAFALLTAALADKAELWDAIAHLPAWVGETLTRAATTHDWAQRYRYVERFAVIGRGYNYCTAFEISLKIKELCYITGEGYSEADFRHGPIATIGGGFPVIVVAPTGATFDQTRDLLIRLNERGAECLAITDSDALDTIAHRVLRIPAGVPEWLSPIAAVVPGQVFAMHLAGIKGNPIDAPRGLTKVTNTR